MMKINEIIRRIYYNDTFKKIKAYYINKQNIKNKTYIKDYEIKTLV